MVEEGGGGGGGVKATLCRNCFNFGGWVRVGGRWVRVGGWVCESVRVRVCER